MSKGALGGITIATNRRALRRTAPPAQRRSLEIQLSTIQIQLKYNKKNNEHSIKLLTNMNAGNTVKI